MHTRSLTEPRRPVVDEHRSKVDLVDDHPLMCCTPTVLGGHAHLKRNAVTVERVLEALQRERRPGPLRVGTRGASITDEEVRAVIVYAVAIFNDISRLYAELDRLQHAKEPTK